MIEPLLALAIAISLDMAAGDPRSALHPTAWTGRLIGRIIPYGKTGSAASEKIWGALFVTGVTALVVLCIAGFYMGVGLLAALPAAVLSVAAGAVLLKSTIAIRGMERHALDVLRPLEEGNIGAARERLSMIVKRDTSNLDRRRILSGVLESVSENTVDGVTGPLFYFGIFGLFGAFVYRTVNTFDSMIGYRSGMFRNLGWFAAYSDRILNYLPARLTALVMVIASFLLRNDWRGSYRAILRDSSRTESPNAGYPMAALAGALGTALEKPGHYTIGDGAEPDISHVRSSISIMKATCLLFCALVTAPMVAVLSYIGWWIHV
ncbi:cobalamin biosynthesis protein [Cenarchaeum symbiosum A]|uniref:Probable cobalamin biosynthesis protein CobD n=1 Tax=Cenarchaeum symbiosum (strain A) TaxID=414004 RepID=A0RZ33_CENSY|nr:cobalamin biosynthesis protein [Cenarchaeum symbiosum A]